MKYNIEISIGSFAVNCETINRFCQKVLFFARPFGARDYVLYMYKCISVCEYLKWQEDLIVYTLHLHFFGRSIIHCIEIVDGVVVTSGTTTTTSTTNQPSTTTTQPSTTIGL